MTQSTDYPHEQLLSEHAKGRVFEHFYRSHPLPANITPHPAPLELVGGVPNHKIFPIESIKIGLRSKPFATGYQSDADFVAEAIDQDALTFDVPVEAEEGAGLIDIKYGLQYSNTQGLDPLLKFTTEFTEKVIKPGFKNWKTILTLGGANGASKAFDAVVNPGDVVLAQEFTFTPVIYGAKEKGATIVPVKLDFEDGSLDYADNLKHLLENWEKEQPGLPKPKAFYVIPDGQNPLGFSESLEHKKKVYALAEKYDFIIIEDEPYAYLNFSKADETPKYDLTSEEFITALGKSYIALDTTGRVIRLESFSKVYAPGMRLGFVIAHERVIQLINNCTVVTTRNPSGLSQIVMNNTVHALGGFEGYLKWIIKVRNEYLKRKNTLVKALLSSEAAKKGLVRVNDPECGMFVSLVIKTKDEFKGNYYEYMMNNFRLACVETGITVVCGGNMSVGPDAKKERGNFVRISLASAPDLKTFEDAAKRLSDAAIIAYEKK